MLVKKYLICLGLVGFATSLGCEETRNPLGMPDLSLRRDMAQGNNDLAGGDEDMAAGGDDMAGGCIKVASWPKNLPSAYFDPSGPVTGAGYADATALPFKALTLEDWHINAAETYPKNLTFTSADKYATCDVCPLILDCTAANGCEPTFFAQAGTMSVTKADTDPLVGRMTATATNLKLVEWDFSAMGDKPAASGACYEVASMTWDIAWDERPDGGVTDMAATPQDMVPVDLAGVDLNVGCTAKVNEVATAGSAPDGGVMDGGAPSADEFVEIYNPCVAAQTLTGFTIRYRSTNNNEPPTGAIYTFPATTLAPGAYYLVAGLAYKGTKDGTFVGGTSLGVLGGKGGAVGLVSPQGVRRDSVSWGTLAVTNTFTEGTHAVAPPAGMSIARTPNGADSDNNSVDFKAAVPTPRGAN